MKESKLTLFIVNPSAGHGKCQIKWGRLYEKIKDSLHHEVIYTTHAGEAEKEARKACERGIGRLIIVGGDGTVNEVINGVGNTPIEIGIIPFGTGNDLAKTLGIPSKMDDLESMFINPETMVIKEVNVAEINERKFMIACGIGFDGMVAKKANDSRFIKSLGPLGYLLSAMMTLRTFQPMKIDVQVDGSQHTVNEGWLLAVGNGPYYGGGMKICPSAKIDDDLLDLCIVSNLTKPKLLRFMPKVYTGRHAHLKQYVTFQRGRKITIHCHVPTVSHADGEWVDSSHLDIQLCHYKLKMLIPS